MVYPMLLYTCKEVITGGQEKKKREPDKTDNTTAHSDWHVPGRISKFYTGSQIRGGAKAPNLL